MRVSVCVFASIGLALANGGGASVAHADDKGVTLLAGTSKDGGKKSNFRIVFDPATGQLRYQTLDQLDGPPKKADCSERAAESTFRAFPIFFELDKDTLKDDSRTDETLGAIKDFLVEHPETEVRIEGHSDTQSTADYNQNLSQRRAVTVMNWLVGHGVNEDRVLAVGKGESSPNFKRGKDDDTGVDEAEYQACAVDGGLPPPTCEERVWSKTRRVEVWVTKGVQQLSKRCREEQGEHTEQSIGDVACPFLVGPRLGVLGPHSWVNAGLSVQPRDACWLELGLTAGLMVNEAEFFNDGTNDVTHVPLVFRGSLWFGDEHAFVPEVGVGVTPYMSDDGLTAEFLGHAGVGYGYRSTRGAGWRFGATIGGVFQTGDGFLAKPKTSLEGGELGLFGELRASYLFGLDGE